MDKEMKKVLLTVGVAFALMLGACSGGVDAKIDKVESMADECIELIKEAANGDQDAAKKLEETQPKIEDLVDEIKTDELTEEQKQRLDAIAMKVVKAGFESVK